MVVHRALRARRVRTTGIGGEVRHGVTSGVSCETSLSKYVTPRLHRQCHPLDRPPSCCQNEPTPFMVSDERAVEHLNQTLGSSLIAAYQKLLCLFVCVSCHLLPFVSCYCLSLLTKHAQLSLGSFASQDCYICLRGSCADFDVSANILGREILYTTTSWKQFLRLRPC